MSTDLIPLTQRGPIKLSIERTPDGRMRTTRFGISPTDVIRVTDRKPHDIVDFFLQMIPEFCARCHIPAEEAVLNSFYDHANNEHVLFLETLHPVSPPAPAPLPDPTVIDI